MERQAGLGRSLEDVLDSVPPVEPLEPARTDVLFGIASEEPPVVNGTSDPEPLGAEPLDAAPPSDSTKKKKNKKKSKGKGDKKKKKKKK